MDSETDTSVEGHLKNEDRGQKPSTTAISTIVLNSKPIQLVVALLQSGDTYHIKVVEIDPKLTFLGSNIDEAVLLQKQHDEVFKQLQNKNSPMDEFVPKAEQILQQNQARPEVIDAMGQSLSLAWSDVLKLMQQKKHILDLNANFHEKLGICKGKMSALEMACRDTMIPIEIESVQEFLSKFKQLRIEVLASVMVALKEGNELLANLRELAHTGTVDSRPDHIKYEVKKSVHQVEKWLEDLHDRRNVLESAWQTRKIQLEQCLALAIFAKELADLETILKNRKNELSSMPNLGDSESSAIHLLQDYIALKQDAVSLRDKALKITRATEKLVTTGCFAGDEACSKAYGVLNGCVEYLDSVEQIENLLIQSKEFFAKAERALSVLEKLEIEVSTTKHADGSSEAINIHAKVLNEIVGLTDEPLRLGYAILAEIGRSNANVSGIERVIEEIENRKIYLEEICTMNSEHSLKVSESLNEFLEKHNKILSWLVSIAEASLRNNNSMGTSLPECNEFLKIHHQLLSDLEARGNEINNQLLTVTQILNEIEDDQRKDVDQKVDAIHNHWTELKNIVENRVDLVTILIQFLKLADSLSNMFNYLENVLKNVPEEDKMNQLNTIWSKVQPAYAQLKSEGERFIDETSKVADPYLETKTACRCVEDILNDFRGRQFNITESWESWTTRLVEQRESVLLWETIMTENTNKINAASKLDAQLYPVLTTPSQEPVSIKQFVSDKLNSVLGEITKASNEIDQRIHTTSALQPKDDETRDKVKQVIKNLYGIKDKLSTISSNYRFLLESLISFLGNIVNTQTEIETYFRNKSQQSVNQDVNVDTVLSDHERFKDRIMQQFRELISESEKLIDIVRDQEPDGAKEHDADRIIRLLEQLRMVFETQSDGRSNELSEKKKQNAILKFNKELNDIHQNLDDITKQLNDTQGQYGETAASARTISLGFEYFERTIELMEKRIVNFIHTSENISKTYPDIGRFVDDEVHKLKQRWEDILARTQNTRRTIDLANEYFELSDGIDQTYRDHSNNLQNITNQIIHIKTFNEAKNLITNIDNYITNNEGQQLDRLKSLSNLSNKIYGFDKTVPQYSDNISLFQSFFKLKSDLNTLADRFQAEEEANLQKSRDEADRRMVDVQVTKQESLLTFSETVYEHPMFTQPLCDATIQEGDKIILQCIAKGKPEPVIEWFKDGMSIQNNPDYHRKYDNGLCTLSIEETFAEDSARFMCKASNCVGTTETTCMLSVKEARIDEMLVPPSFVKFLENGLAKEGGSFEFHCTVTGNPLPTVQWFKNDTCIDNLKDYCISYNNGEAVLRFEEVFLEDQAVFTCKATNMVGMVQCSAGLSVQSLQPSEMPVFRVPLTNIMARVGQKIKLECEITGTPRPQIHWTHNGKPFTGRDFKSLYDNERATLVIPEAFPKDAGVYIVTAKNLAGEAYSSCNVSVKGRLPNETSDSELASDMEPVKPSVQLPLKDICVFEGKSVRLDCVIVGQPEPEVIWYHNNRPVKESVDVQLLFQGDRCSLIIQEAYLEDGGDYRVVAINSAGEASSSCKLSITPLNELEPATRSQNDRILPSEMPPKFERLLSDILADEGEVIEFECSLSGDPKPLIKWYLNNKEIFESDRIKFIQNDDGTVKLIIHNVTNLDKGVYTVKASNSCGDAKCFSHLIVKSVNAPESLNIQISQADVETNSLCPTFKELFKDKTAQIDDTAKFECIIVGKPTPKIKWMYNDQPVAGRNFLVSTSGDRQVLTIPKVHSETVGKISCIAENEVGKATCVAYLNLHGDFNPPSSEQSQRYIEEHNTESSNVTIRKQLFTTTHTSQVNTFDNANGIPQTQVHAFSSKLDHSFKKIGDQSPEVLESKQFQEYRQLNDLPPQMQQKSIVNFIKPNINEGVAELPKIVRKNVSPRFVSPLIGKIVDQGSDVMLEAIVDGYPVPELTVTKNGEPLSPSANVVIVHKFNKINIELRNIAVEDAGRYSCTATNPAGSSTSTADVVVKKSVFPPVFGHRLQAQVAKRGERIRMDVEVSGTPPPTVTWFKDNQLLNNNSSDYSLKQSGNNYTLIIESAKNQDAGKYMVRAVNAGGEAQSIADFAVMEPTPERMVEVVKTVVFDNINDKKEAEIPVTTNLPSSFHSSQHQLPDSNNHATTEQTIFTETTHTTEATMRMEHKAAFPELTTTHTQNSYTQQTPVKSQSIFADACLKSLETNINEQPKLLSKTITEESSIDSSSIPKSAALNFFANKMKADEMMAVIPEEKYTKFEVLNKPVLIMPDNTYNSKSDINSSTLNNELADLNLVPGTPPEIGFMPKLEESKNERVTDKIKKLEDSHNAVKLVPEIKRHETIAKEFVQTSHIIMEPIIRPQAHHANDDQLSALRCASPRPSAEGVAMDKLWSTPKSLQPEKQFDKSNYYTSKNEFAEEKSSYNKFPPADETDGEQKDLVNTERKTSTKQTAKMFEEKIKELENSPRHDYDLKAPGMVKQILPRPQLERPKSVQESVLPDIYLEPGSPPEMCYAPRTERKLERKHSLVETIEQVVQQEGPSKVLPGSVRMVPPPPKKEKSSQETFSSKQIYEQTVTSKESSFPVSQAKPLELEAFPFIPEPEQPKPEKLPPPPTPSKFVRVTFADSDYSDTDTKMSSKWTPGDSESEDCKYAPVHPPVAVNQNSQQPNVAVPSPCQFEIPKQSNGDTRPFIEKSAPFEIIKHKPKVISGYMADTEEVYHKTMTSSEHKYETTNSVHQSKQMFEAMSNQQQQPTYSNTNQTQNASAPVPPTKHYRHYVQKHDSKDETPGQYEKNFTTSSLIQKNISMNSKSIKFHEEPRLEPLPFVPEPSRPKASVKVPPPPSPSKFVKGEFRESDYESDYDRKVPPIWRPTNDSDSEPMYYKPIRPILTPTGRQSKLSDGKSPIPPTEFENPLQFEGPPRPKFEPIDKPKTTFVKVEPITKPVAQQQLFKPKPVAARPQQQSTFQQQPTQFPKQPCRYYTAVTGPPQHLSTTSPQHIAAETSNTMHMRESTESSHRVVNMSQTKRIIQFDARKSDFEQKLEPFPYTADGNYTQRPRLPPPPTPTKFVPAEFRESDYESEVESARIRPVWTPNPSDSDEPQYRKVAPPQQYRSASVPRSYGSYGRVLTPMEFDNKPIEMPSKIVIETSGPRIINKTQTLNRYSSKKSNIVQSTTRDDIDLKPSSPPKYGFIPGQMVNQAEQHMYDMNSTFKTKAQQFVSDVVRDTQTPNIRPILKKENKEGDGAPQIYREDSRVSQYGTKHIDPNTGLIYFKYDFGYEFGIIFPGEGKKIIGGTRHITHDTSMNNKKPFHSSASDINIPVVHERTAAGNSIKNGYSSPNEYLLHLNTNDPKRKRLSLPAQIDVDSLTRATPDRTTPNYIREKSWNGRATTPIANYGSNQEQAPKRAPVFITPLKDIAVVNGNSARFECIVQCDPYPNISWSRNGVPINQSPKYVIEFRNGVCRLTIPQAFTGDAGTYSCTGSNNIGSVTTSAELLIPSDQWGFRK